MTTLPRRPFRTLTTTALALALATATATASLALAAPASADEITPTPIDPQALQVLDETNAARATAGCAPLLLMPLETGVADGHADQMAATGDFSHTGPDGSSPRSRLAAVGVRPQRTAENIALGYDAASVVDAWMASPGHRANILDCSLVYVGISERQGVGGQYWTQVFSSL